MKTKIMAAAIFVLGLAAWAAPINAINDLNVAVEKVLAPFQNNLTAARLSFVNVETDAQHALALDLNAYYRKLGQRAELELNVRDLAYNYNQGVNPTTNVDLGYGIDLTKVFTQDELNELVPEL